MVQTIRHLADGKQPNRASPRSRSRTSRVVLHRGACGSYPRAGFAARINSNAEDSASRNARLTAAMDVSLIGRNLGDEVTRLKRYYWAEPLEARIVRRR